MALIESKKADHSTVNNPNLTTMDSTPQAGTSGPHPKAAAVFTCLLGGLAWTSGDLGEGLAWVERGSAVVSVDGWVSCWS